MEFSEEQTACRSGSVVSSVLTKLFNLYTKYYLITKPFQKKYFIEAKTMFIVFIESTRLEIIVLSAK